MTNPKLEVLTPKNSQIIFIDPQPQMAFGVQSIDRQTPAPVGDSPKAGHSRARLMPALSSH